jgi:hypothetical protein
MKTSQEKAQELVAKFMPHSTGNSNRNEAIECALIAVDEVINSMTVATSVHLPYWQQVKHEIENI